MQTNFMARVGAEGASLEMIEDYLPFVDRISKLYGGMGSNADSDAVDKVVASIFEAANDSSDKLSFAPTNDIRLLLESRRGSSEDDYRALTLSLFSPKSA